MREHDRVECLDAGRKSVAKSSIAPLIGTAIDEDSAAVRCDDEHGVPLTDIEGRTAQIMRQHFHQGRNEAERKKEGQVEEAHTLTLHAVHEASLTEPFRGTML